MMIPSERREKSTMWKRKELKKNARRSIRQNYWRMVSVCFLIALLTAFLSPGNRFSGSASVISYWHDFQSAIRLLRPKTTSQILEETATRLFHNTDIENLYQNPSATYTNLLVDLYADSTSTFFAVLKIFNTFLDEHFDFIVFILGISAILAFLYRIFVNNILGMHETLLCTSCHDVYCISSNRYKILPTTRILKKGIM